MDFKDSPLFHFIVGTLWSVAAAVTAYEHRTFSGPVFWPSILLGIAGIGYYVRCIYLIIKNRQHTKKQ